MAAWPAIGLDGDPFRMRLLRVIVSGVRIGAGNHDQAEFAAASDEVPEGIGIGEPLAAVVKWNFCRVIRDAAAGAETNRVGAGALKVIEPKLWVEFAWVILHQSELRSAHRLVHPIGSG